MDGVAADYFTDQPIFGDRRLDRRLGVTFNKIAKRPEGSLPKKLIKRGPLVGNYRMLNNDKVTPHAMLASHQDRCIEQLKGFCGKALLIHDTTVLDYSGLGLDSLGQVGDGHGRGLYAHNSLLILPDTREVVGLMNQILHIRDDVPAGESREARRQRAGRESRLWKQAVASLPMLDETVRVTDVSDRGSDITEYIAYEIAARRTFIVRSQHNRKLADGQGNRQVEKLHDQLRALKLCSEYTQRVPKKRGGWREAKIGLAWQAVAVLPPRQPRGDHDQTPLNVSAVLAREIDPPDGEEPVEWILLTNHPVDSVEDAREVVEDYACRWMIEEYHKALKSGCGVETLQMTTHHGLTNAITLLSVMGVHLLRLRCKARSPQTGDQPAYLHEDAMKVQLAAKDAKHADWKTMTVWAFYIAVAKMGGYMLNPRKKPPGWQTLWRGYTRLEDMCEGLRLMGQRCVQS